MKKYFLGLLLFILSLGLVACDMNFGGTTSDNKDDDKQDETVYNIEYSLNQGEFEVEAKETYKEGDVYTFPIPVREKYDFLGWFDLITDEEVKGITKDMAKDVVVYAKWERQVITHTITYHVNGGEMPEEYNTSYVEGTQATLAKPIRQGYFFRGWYTDSDFTTQLTIINDKQETDFELYAKWEEAIMANTTFGIFGDSISTFYDMGDPNSSIWNGDNQFYYPRYCPQVSSSAQCWWMRAINALGAKLLVNNSYSGGTVTGSGTSCGQNDNRILKFTVNKQSPDVIIILMGANDQVSGKTAEEFGEAYQNMLDKISRYYPTTQIFICTMFYETYSKDNGANRLVLNEVIRNLGKENNIPVIELADIWGPDTEIKNNWKYLYDNMHPSSLGMQVIGNAVTAAIKDFYNIN